MRMTWLRRLAGGTALAVGFAAVGTGALAEDAVPASSTEAAIAADTAHLTKLFELAKGGKKKIEARVKATAALIAVEAQDGMAGANAEKMAGVRDAAIKVALAAGKKDLAGAEEAAKGLASPTGGKKDPVNVAKETKLDLGEVMDLFGGSGGGGLNIEKDIREAKKNGPKDAKAAELIGVRSAALATLYLETTPEFTAQRTKADWTKWATQAKKQGADIAAEASKGAKADAAKLKKLITALDATCTSCHNTFKD